MRLSEGLADTFPFATFPLVVPVFVYATRRKHSCIVVVCRVVLILGDVNHPWRPDVSPMY